MATKNCTLYSFIKELYKKETPSGCGMVRVARITTGHPKDWNLWFYSYLKEHPDLRLIEISSIEIVDETDINANVSDSRY